MKALRIILLLLLAVSCTEVRFSETLPDGTIPGVPDVNLHIDWNVAAFPGKALPEDLPVSFDVALARLTPFKPYYFQGMGAFDPVSNMEAGEYQSFAWATSGTYNIEDLEGAAMDPAGFRNLREVYAAVPAMTPLEAISAIDTPEEQPYLLRSILLDEVQFPILNTAEGIYRASAPLSLSAGAEEPYLDYRLEPYVQTVTFEVRLEAPADIRAVDANIIGVSRRLELYTGYLDTNPRNLGQMPFKMYHDPDDKDLWKGAVQILGAVAPADRQANSGPGILRIAVLLEGREQARVCEVNLFKLIYEPLLHSTATENRSTGGAILYTYLADTVTVGESGSGTQGGGDPVNDWGDTGENADDIIDGEGD